MGEVHAAYDRRAPPGRGRQDAAPDLADRNRLVRRFEEEARIAARLVHPHAVAVFDVGEDRGVPYLVMELVEGATLADEIACGPLDAEAGGEDLAGSAGRTRGGPCRGHRPPRRQAGQRDPDREDRTPR